jgi:hypothetical protein
MGLSLQLPRGARATFKIHSRRPHAMHGHSQRGSAGFTAASARVESSLASPATAAVNLSLFSALATAWSNATPISTARMVKGRNLKPSHHETRHDTTRPEQCIVLGMNATMH